MCFVLVGFAVCGEIQLNSPSDVPRLSIEELKTKLGQADLAIIDVRSTHDWEESSKMIKGAFREDSRQVYSWLKKYPKDKTIVLYCK